MNKKAFSIIELLITVVIISIIISIALPSIYSILRKNKEKNYEEYNTYLKDNLHMYNIDLQEDLWTERETEYLTVSKEELKARNKDLNINHEHCVIAGNMSIIKNNKNFDYKVCIYCDKAENGSYIYNGANYTYKSADCD